MNAAAPRLAALALCLSATCGQAATLCAPLPESLSNVPVANLSSVAELQRVDERLVEALSHCLSPSGADAIKAACAHAEGAAAQALRVVARVDAASRRNEVLKHAKMKAYYTANQILEESVQLHQRRQCR